MRARLTAETTGRPLWLLLEPFLWCCLALLAALAHLPPDGRPRLDIDSYQYLSTAAEMRSAHALATPLVHFDTERSQGIIPAPLTWFPPGYPAAVAAVSYITGSYERAAFVISISCFVLLTGGLWCLMGALDGSPWAGRAAMLCWLCSAQAGALSFSALSEPLFTLAGLLGVLFLVSLEREATTARNWVGWLGAAVMVGASYWVRYAGLIWVAAFFALLVWRMFVRRGGKPPSWRLGALAGAVVLACTLPFMIRNQLLVHDWRGSNTSPAGFRPQQLLVEPFKGLLHLVLGDAALPGLWVGLGLMAAGLVSLACVALWKHQAGDGESESGWAGSWAWARVVLPAALAYGVGVTLISARSVVSLEPRKYYPIWPHLIALTICGAAWLIRRVPARTAWRWAARGAAVCLLVGYLAGNMVSMAAAVPSDYADTVVALRAPDATGRPMRAVIAAELAPGEAIAANNGQTAGYVLGHPVLSLIAHYYSPIRWDETTLRREMARFHLRHLLVFRDSHLDSVTSESPFVAALAAGQPPEWLETAACSSAVCLYRLRLVPAPTAPTAPTAPEPAAPAPAVPARTVRARTVRTPAAPASAAPAPAAPAADAPVSSAPAPAAPVPATPEPERPVVTQE